MDIHGVVVDERLQPLRANVTLAELNQTVVTSSTGTFQFTNLVAGTYFVRAAAPEYRTKVLTVDPQTASQQMRFQLDPLPTNVPYNESVRFHGHIQCALEAAIITPSCDTLVLFAEDGAKLPETHLFNDTFETSLPVSDNWKTVVADVVFDPSQQPALDGLRVTVRGTYDQKQLDTYQQYGRFNASAPFAFRLEPGQTYPEGQSAVPANTTMFVFDVYPQSQAWHATCQPPLPEDPSHCLLGVGAGVDVDFTLVLTTFYVAPAPTGFVAP